MLGVLAIFVTGMQQAYVRSDRSVTALHTGVAEMQKLLLGVILTRHLARAWAW